MNGYIQIEVNGKNVGLKFNMYALEQFQSIKGNNTLTKYIATVIYAGVLGNAYVKQIEPELTFEEVNDFYEEQFMAGDPNGVLDKISSTFIESQAYKFYSKAKEEDDSKKKKKR